MPRLMRLKSAQIAACLMVAFLAGCAQTTSQLEASVRDAAVPMSSIVSFDVQRFAGRWHEVEAYLPEGASCAIGGITFSQQTNGDLIVTEGPCSDGAPRSGVAARVGPGRFAFGGDVLWVLWVNQTYDVAVIATEAGRAHILSRSLSLPADKRQAAHDILTWNGFDVTGLKPARRR